MRFAILSLVAAGALALAAGSARAHPPGYRGYYGPSYYGGGFNNPGWSGSNITIGTPRGFGISIGSGNVYPSYGWNRSYYGGWNGPSYGGWNSGYRPYYGGWNGYRGYNWRR